MHTLCAYGVGSLAPTHLRARYGTDLKESIRINHPPNDSDGADLVSIDITVQEKNIIYPTDDKL